MFVLEVVKVEICFFVIVNKGGRVDGVGFFDGFWVGGEGVFGLVIDCDIDVEDVFFVVGGEVEVVFFVFGGCVRCLELFGDLGDVFCFEDDVVVDYRGGGVEGFGGEDVVVGYVVLVVIVVELDIGFLIVGGVDVDFVFEDVG